jgi:hypothetical protein
MRAAVIDLAEKRLQDRYGKPPAITGGNSDDA